MPLTENAHSLTHTHTSLCATLGGFQSPHTTLTPTFPIKAIFSALSSCADTVTVYLVIS